MIVTIYRMSKTATTRHRRRRSSQIYRHSPSAIVPLHYSNAPTGIASPSGGNAMVKTTVTMDRTKLAVLMVPPVIQPPLRRHHHHSLAEPITSSVTTVTVYGHPGSVTAMQTATSTKTRRTVTAPRSSRTNHPVRNSYASARVDASPIRHSATDTQTVPIIRTKKAVNPLARATVA